VRHIPDLSKNLISLGFLEEKGCKFQSDGGVLRVSKGALTIMRGKRVGNLYFLQGSTVTGSVSIASSDPTSDVNVTKLWHMRLGHMSERGMTILSKRDLLCGQCTSSLEFCEHCVFGKQKRLSFSTAITGPRKRWITSIRIFEDLLVCHQKVMVLAICLLSLMIFQEMFGLIS